MTSDLIEIVDLEAPAYYEQRPDELADALGIRLVNTTLGTG
jgi:hypothetical protein